VPDAPFCARCGAAMRACSRQSRRDRRDDRPTRLADDPAAGEIGVGLLPGYSTQSGTFETATKPPTTSFRTVALALVIAVIVLAGG
ncbi:zinc ribbon domain-containing protein, partial [Mycobacterium sp. ITM-2017-0098]